MHLVLVHGALGASEQLEPLRAILARDHDVTLVELEGHGSSAAAGSDYTMRRFVENIRTHLRDETAIFGYSMGGYAALLLAAEEPVRVTRVITLGTKLAWTPEVAVKEASRLDPAVIRAKVPRFADQLEQRHRGAGGWESVLRKTALLMTDLGARPPIDDSLVARISQPARLMVGDRDALVSVDETAAFARKLSAGELAVLPGTPHPIEQVRPDLIASLIADGVGRSVPG